MKLLVVAADRRELAGLLRRCGRLERLGWPLDFAAAGELNGRQCVMAANGPGRALAAQAARLACAQEKPDALLSTGWCGGLDPGLARGDIFVASQVEAPAGGLRYTTAVPRTNRQYRFGRLITVDRVVRTVREKAALAATGAAAVDMEAAAVAAEAQRAQAPFYCVRVVLDTAGEGFEMDWNGLRKTDGRFSRAGILKAVLARPMVLVPELIRLERSSRLAARVLGDFLGDCGFEL